MICNNQVTIYHKGFDETNHIEKWDRYNYPNAWFFGGKGANRNRGYENANNVEIRLPYSKNELDINNFAIGDIIVEGNITQDIDSKEDLDTLVYEITSINNNNFGLNPHIHIGGL